MDILKTLPEGIILHATQTLGGPVHFHNINDKEATCVGLLSEPFLNILNNIFISTAAVFHQYELILTSLFPMPKCPTMIFNIPSELRSVYFIKFPRIIAIMLKKKVMRQIAS